MSDPELYELCIPELRAQAEPVCNADSGSAEKLVKDVREGKLYHDYPVAGKLQEADLRLAKELLTESDGANDSLLFSREEIMDKKVWMQQLLASLDGARRVKTDQEVLSLEQIEVGEKEGWLIQYADLVSNDRSKRKIKKVRARTVLVCAGAGNRSILQRVRGVPIPEVQVQKHHLIRRTTVFCVRGKKELIGNIAFYASYPGLPFTICSNQGNGGGGTGLLYITPFPSGRFPCGAECLANATADSLFSNGCLTYRNPEEEGHITTQNPQL